jgi:hypothetical protein
MGWTRHIADNEANRDDAGMRVAEREDISGLKAPKISSSEKITQNATNSRYLLELDYSTR